MEHGTCCIMSRCGIVSFNQTEIPTDSTDESERYDARRGASLQRKRGVTIKNKKEHDQRIKASV